MSELNFEVIDLETSIKCPVGNLKASPYWLPNKVVLMGHCLNDGDVRTRSSVRSDGFSVPEGETLVLVGHNIKFDLLWLERYNRGTLQKILTGPVSIWDTMHAEYLLSGQEHKFPSMDFCAERYELKLKPSHIKEYWDAGVDTEDIPQDELRDYLVHDVRTTSRIFMEQVKEMEGRGMMDLATTQMEAILATTVMENNGLKFDEDKCRDLELAIEETFADLEWELVNFMVDHDCYSPNPGSQVQLKCLLYGGTYNTKYKTPMLDEDGNPVVFKSGVKKGMKRFKNEEIEVKLPGLFPSQPLKYQKTDASTIKKLIPTVHVESVKDFLENLLEYKKLQKELSSYYRKLPALTFDGFLHPMFNHSATATGRLSSSNPNFQNMAG